MASVFRDIIEFFGEIGIYDVVLPFLLVFTIVFAILEKTRVLGTEEIEGKNYSKKNLNAMVAFVLGFIVVASAELVDILTEVSGNMVILLLLSICFLLLVGSFYKETKDGVYLEGTYKIIFMFIMFVGIVIIFLQAIKTDTGEPWLEWFLSYIVDNFQSTAVASIVLVLAIVLFMYWVVREPTPKGEKKED